MELRISDMSQMAAVQRISEGVVKPQPLVTDRRLALVKVDRTHAVKQRELVNAECVWWVKKKDTRVQSVL